MVMEARHVSPKTDRARTKLPWTRIDLDLYEITRAGSTVGFVEVVGPVFVALSGPRYDRAVEVRQELTFHAAVDAVQRHR